MKKVLIIRFSSIGDIVLTTPVIRAIVNQKGYDVHTLTKESYSFIYENNPNISKVYSFKRSISECISDLNNEKYDFVIDLQKNIRSIKLRKELKVPGYSFPKVNIEKWLLVNFKINRLPNLHIVDRYFKAVEALNIVSDGLGLEFYIPPRDEVAPETIDNRLKSGYIAFVIGGQHETKIFPPGKVAEVISMMDKPAVLLGGKNDRKRGEEIIKMANKSDIINTCGEFNLNQSASLLRLSDIVVTNDTGLMHIAAAFKKKTVSIWGNTVPEFGMFPYMPDNEDNYIISQVKHLKCRPCSKLGYSKCPKKHFKCMINQDANKIANDINNFLNR